MTGSKAQRSPRRSSQSPGSSLVLFSGWWHGGGSPNSCPHLGPEWSGAPGVCSERGRHHCGQLATHPPPRRLRGPRTSGGLLRAGQGLPAGGAEERTGRRNGSLLTARPPRRRGTREPGTGNGIGDCHLRRPPAGVWLAGHRHQRPGRLAAAGRVCVRRGSLWREDSCALLTATRGPSADRVSPATDRAQGGIATLINPPSSLHQWALSTYCEPSDRGQSAGRASASRLRAGAVGGATGGRPRLSHRQGLLCTPCARSRLPTDRGPEPGVRSGKPAGASELMRLSHGAGFE